MSDTAAPVGRARPGNAATEPLRSSFVAATGLPSSSGAGTAHRADHRGAAAQRLNDELLRQAMEAAPLLAGSVALALVAALLVLDATPARIVWGCAAVLLGAAWLALTRLRWWLRWRRNAAPPGERQRAFVALGIALLLLVAALPWLGLGSQQRTMLMALGAVGLGGAMVFATLRGAVIAAALLPLSVPLADGLRAPELGLAAAAMAALIGLAAGTASRLRRRRARGLLDAADRILELEAARDLAQRADQDKSRFLAVASHDLRQPVHALGLFAATLEKRLRGSSDEPLVRNLVRSIDGLDRSFNAMLDISRLDAGTVEPNFQQFPLRDLFRRLHMHFAGLAEQAGLVLRFSPGGKSVTSDPQLLERILGNLIQNAIKYTEHGGVVVLARSTATHINVEVWDTGVGIRAAELPRVFDEFYQVGLRERARQQGLGMGLAIVKRLARLLEHRLTVVSQPGRGTLFRIGIRLGGLPEMMDMTAAADTLPLPALQPRTVLIVDDEPAIRESLTMLLEEWGYQALAAADLAQALRALRTLDLPPDLILSDLHLGDGPDGIDVIEQLRQACGGEVPAILITGDTSHEEMRRATDSGHPVLFKPVQARKLLNAMRGLVS